MNDQRKTKNQLMQELQRERELVRRERERSIALQEVSSKVAAVHDTDEVLDLIVNEAARLLGADGAIIWLLEGDEAVPRAATETAAEFFASAIRVQKVGEGTGVVAHVLETKKPLYGNAVLQVVTPESISFFKEQGRDPAAGAVVPLLANDRSIGTLIIADYTGNRRFTEDDVSLLAAFADQAALALEKARLLHEAETERGRADALYQVSSLLAGAHETDEVLDLIVNEAARLLDRTAAYIRLLEGDLLVPRAATQSAAALIAGLEESGVVLSVGEGIMGQVMATKTPIVTNDVAEEETAHSEGSLIHQRLGFKATAAVPLVANGRSIGVLSVIDTRVRRFTDDEVSLLIAFADQAALALEKARLLNEAEREKERSDALYRVSNLLAGAHDTDEVLDLIVNESKRLLGADGAIMRLLEGDSLVAKAASDPTSESYTAALPIRKVEEGTSATGHVLATKKPLAGDDIARFANPEALRVFAEQGRDPAASAIVPLLANDRALGTITVADYTGHRRFTEDEVSLLTAFSDQAALALEKARLLNEAETERERSDALYRVSNLLAGAHDTDEVLDLIVNEASRLVGVTAAYIRLLEGGALVARAATKSAAAYLAEASESRPTVDVEDQTTLMGRVMATRNPITVDDVTKDESLPSEGRRLVQTNGFHGVAAVPLSANDRSLGVLFVWDLNIRRFTDDEISLLTAFADQASLALEKARLLNEAETREQQATELYEVTTQLASSSKMDGMLDLISEKARNMLEAGSSGFLRYDEAKGILVSASSFNLSIEASEKLIVRPGRGLSGMAFTERRPMWTRDYQTDERVVESRKPTIEVILESGACCLFQL